MTKAFPVAGQKTLCDHVAMEELLNEIERALQAELWYLAFSCSLTLPDLCAALLAENNKSNQKKYKRWCSTWLNEVATGLSSDDLWELRCAVSHEGQLRLPARGPLTSRELVFVAPNRRVRMENNRITMPDGRQVIIHMLDTVCSGLIASTRRWYATEGEQERVQLNLTKLLQKRPEGRPPFLLGVPVIC